MVGIVAGEVAVFDQTSTGVSAVKVDDFKLVSSQKTFSSFCRSCVIPDTWWRIWNSLPSVDVVLDKGLRSSYVIISMGSCAMKYLRPDSLKVRKQFDRRVCSSTGTIHQRTQAFHGRKNKDNAGPVIEFV